MGATALAKYSIILFMYCMPRRANPCCHSANWDRALCQGAPEPKRKAGAQRYPATKVNKSNLDFPPPPKPNANATHNQRSHGATEPRNPELFREFPTATATATQPEMPPPKTDKDRERRKEGDKDKDKAKTHKLSLKGSARLVAEFVGCP